MKELKKILNNQHTDDGDFGNFTRRPRFTPGVILVLISLTGWVKHRATMQLQGLRELKNPMTSTEIGPATFRLVR
jgi:hypothetical protein